jgi:hypothetical protein
MTYQPHILSKSTFMYGCQCPKRLYLHKFEPGLKNPEDEMQQSIFAAGTNVGVLAHELFPGGVNAEPPTPYEYHLSVAKTEELIKAGVEIIYEAAFNFEGILCALDLLVKQDGQWHAFEVKGSTGVKPQHIMDAALQYYVITQCGLPLADISIVHLNNQYIKRGALDVQELFNKVSIKEEVLELQEFIGSKAIELKQVLHEKVEPIFEPGDHCYAPYECDFTNHCWKDIAEEPKDFGNENMNKEAIDEFMAKLVYPLYFFDFETVMPAVPEFDESRPYQQLPFQYSLHIKHSPEADLHHEYFLGNGITDPREDLIKTLLGHIGNDGSIVVWNKTFEDSRLKELGRDFPQYLEAIESIRTRLVDLMVPFRKKQYYHPEFQGSYSIKKVLPVLVPELSYGNLEVQDGGSASLIYSQLKDQDTETQTKHREGLLAYCEMDTLAMVKILEKMRKT